jgi:hypothetical protein
MMTQQFVSYCTQKCLKEPCHEIFDLQFFSSNNSIWAPDPRVKAFLHMASYSLRYSTRKSIFLVVNGVNDTADDKKFDLIVEYLREYKAICKKALTHGSRAQIELFDEKNRRSKIS